MNWETQWTDWIVKYSSDALFECKIQPTNTSLMGQWTISTLSNIDRSKVIHIKCSIPFISVTSCSDNSIWLANMVNIFTILQSPYYCTNKRTKSIALTIGYKSIAHSAHQRTLRQPMTMKTIVRIDKITILFQIKLFTYFVFPFIDLIVK